MALASVLLEERAALHFDALRPLLNEANPQAGEAITSLQAELRASGINAGAADALLCASSAARRRRPRNCLPFATVFPCPASEL